jgi:phosphatidylglycerol:prolipoprotein diacylglycerol transferase
MPIRGYGIMLLAGIVTGVGMAMVRARQAGIVQETILSLAIWLVIFGVVGARLFHIVEYWDERFAGKTPRETIIEIVNVPEGGLVIYGGLFGAAVGFVLFVRKHRLPLLAMADLIAPSLAIGLALGRIGCFLNGCCYGGQTDWPWAVAFPKYSSPYEAAKPPTARRYSPPYSDQAMRGEMHGFRLDSPEGASVVVTRVQAGSLAAAAGLEVGDSVVAINGAAVNSLADAKELLFTTLESQRPLRLVLSSGKKVEIAAVPMPDRSRPVHPAQLYSAIDAGLLGWLLWAFYPFRRRDGQGLALLLTIHPFTRFLLEIIRTDEPAVFGTGMSISQNISIVLLGCGALLWWYLSKQPLGIVWPLVAKSNGRQRVKSVAAVARGGRP